MVRSAIDPFALRWLTVWLALAALCLAACRAVETPSDASGPAAAEHGVDVYLLPVGEFSFELSDRLARQLSAELEVNVRAALPMGTSALKPLPLGYQFSAEDVIAAAQSVGSRLPGRSARSIVIALTTLDLNDRTQSLRFVFGRNDSEARTSVVSTARLGLSTPTAEATPERVFTRLSKMTKRAIGELYFGFRRSSDIGDVMYAPIMSLEDIDAMGSSFTQRPVPATPRELPPPPQGYAWRRVDAIRAAVLVPEGWHFREQHDGATHAAFVTREETAAGSFEVGVTLNAFVGDPAAPARLKQMIDAVAAKYSAPVSSGARLPFAMLSCQFEAPRSAGQEPVRTYMLAIANTQTRTAYLVLFESPQSEWKATWSLGRTILDTLALETEL